MQPLNKDDRKKAFWTFVWLLLVSIILILTTIYFSVKIPFNQNDELIKTNERENDIKVKEHTLSDNFYSKMLSITNRLDSINSSPRAELIESQVKDDIEALSKMVGETDTLYNRPFYNTIILTLDDYNRAKAILRVQAQKGAAQDNLQDLVSTKDKELNAARDSVRALLMQISKLTGITN
ncbi:MAG: hypothetical protein IT254_04125 [Chitinophagaceae bacterium]|nr:hypothetical protein [Bacteroidota bacterium]MCC6257485.1 hypothetical protein [Chitinophagaceae bacterium]MCW5917769.1 hypothetical protein [Ferruginibacter sp.]